MEGNKIVISYSARQFHGKKLPYLFFLILFLMYCSVLVFLAFCAMPSNKTVNKFFERSPDQHGRECGILVLNQYPFMRDHCRHFFWMLDFEAINSSKDA